MRSWIVAISFVVACDKGTPAEPPSPTPPPGPQPIVTVDAPPSTKELATPKSKRGLIVYSIESIQSGQPIDRGPLTLIDPDGTTPVTTMIAAPRDLVVGSQLIAGRRGGDGEPFVIDLRAPAIVAKKSVHEVEFMTPDGKLVSRCAGGISQPFKICVSDGDPQVWRDLFEEPKRGDDDIGVVLAAGRDIVHGGYAQLSKLPAFSIRIGDKKRTDYPGLIRKSAGYTIEPAYSPNGTKAATCEKQLIVTTLDGSAKPQTIKLDAEPTRCECKFAHDDSKLACSILYKAEETGIDSLWLWDLKSNTKTQVTAQLAIGDFVWSPDDTEIAFVGVAEKPDRWVLRTSSLDGKTVKDLVTIEMRPHLIDLAGWTAP